MTTEIVTETPTVTPRPSPTPTPTPTIPPLPPAIAKEVKETKIDEQGQVWLYIEPEGHEGKWQKLISINDYGTPLGIEVIINHVGDCFD